MLSELRNSYLDDALIEALNNGLPSVQAIVVFSVAAIWMVWYTWSFTVRPWLRPRKPKVYPYYVPFLGQTISFFKNADGMFTRGRLYFENRREPYSLIIAGAEIYVITAAEDVAAVNRNAAELTFDAYIKDMMQHFGATATAINKMWQHPNPKSVDDRDKFPNPTMKPMAHQAEVIIRHQLHPGPRLNDLQDIFLQSIYDSATWSNIKDEVTLTAFVDTRTVSLVGWSRDALLAGATKAFFGESLLRREPDLLESFFTFDDLSWKLSYKIPAPWSNDMHKVRKETQDAFTRYFESSSESRADACWLVKTLESEMRGSGIGSADIAAYLTMIYWVINSNAWKVSFWCLGYLTYAPSLLRDVRDEVSPIVTAGLSPNEMAARLAKAPLMSSVYHDALRLVTSSVSVRDVAQTTVIGNKVLEAGNRVVIPYRQLLCDKAVFGHDADEFNPRRFLENKSLVKSASYRPFGGGTTHCPGRFLAQAEILTFVALVLVRFDIECDRNTQFPRLETRKPCLGIMGPAKGEDVIVRIRRRDGATQKQQ